MRTSKELFIISIINFICTEHLEKFAKNYVQNIFLDISNISILTKVINNIYQSFTAYLKITKRLSFDLINVKIFNPGYSQTANLFRSFLIQQTPPQYKFLTIRYTNSYFRPKKKTKHHAPYLPPSLQIRSALG